MRVNCVIALSSTVKQELLPLQELFDLDQFSSQYENEKQIRKIPEFQSEIDSFLRQKENYRNKITNPVKKNGILCLEYIGQGSTFSRLNLLYKEDLELLKLKKLNRSTFLIRVRSQLLSYLKENENICENFFKQYAYLLSSSYYQKQGYYNYIRDLRSNRNKKTQARSKLFSILQNNLTELPGKEENAYFKARILYEYLKNSPRFKKTNVSSKNSVKNLLLDPPSLKSNAVLSKEGKQGTIESYDSFLEQYLKENPGRGRMADLALDLEEKRDKGRERRG